MKLQDGSLKGDYATWFIIHKLIIITEKYFKYG